MTADILSADQPFVLSADSGKTQHFEYFIQHFKRDKHAQDFKNVWCRVAEGRQPSSACQKIEEAELVLSNAGRENR